MATPSQYIKEGNLFPFDAPDKWWATPGATKPEMPTHKDKWQYIARGIAKFLESKGVLSLSTNENRRQELVSGIAAIIEAGIRSAGGEQTIAPSENSASQRADMAEKIYGKGVEETMDKLRVSIYNELGNLLWAQSKGAVIPPDITVNNIVIPLNPTC